MTWLNDTFTGVDGTLLSAHVGETGATWVPSSGQGGSPAPAIDGNALFPQDGHVWMASGVADADGESVVITLDRKDASTQAVGVVIRGDPATGKYYMGWWHTNDTMRIYRYDGPTSPVLLAAGAATMDIGVNTLKIKTTGTGANVAIELTANGAGTAQAALGDTSGGRIRTLGQGGIYFAQALAANTGVVITSISDGAAAPSFVFSTPADGRIHQRVGSAASVTAAGSYTGTPPNIEARLVLFGTSTVVGGHDWAVKAASPSSGTFSFSFAAVPQGGWYQVQIRNSAVPGTVISSGKVGVGVLKAKFGQSNAYFPFRTGAGTQTANPLLRVHGVIGNWMVPDAATMDGAIAEGNAMIAAFGCPVAILDLAKSGAPLVGDLEVLANPGYQTFINTINAIGGKIECMDFVQGESDAASAFSQANYRAGWDTLAGAIRADLGQPTLPIIFVTLHSIPLGGYGDDAGFQPIRRAHIDIANDANNYRVERTDIALSGDQIHHSVAGFVALGQRIANTAAYAAGLAPYYQGPRISAVVKVTDTVFDVTIAHTAGSDFTPTTGITGFRLANDGASVAISTATRQAANKVRLTLSAPAAGAVFVQYMYGKNPAVSGVLKDNSTLALPLEFTDGVAVGDVEEFATTVTISVIDEDGIPVTGLEDLDYRFYDQPRINSNAPPVKVGSDLSISAGTGTVSIAGATALYPGEIGFLEWGNAAGTMGGHGRVVVS